MKTAVYMWTNVFELHLYTVSSVIMNTWHSSYHELITQKYTEVVITHQIFSAMMYPTKSPYPTVVMVVYPQYIDVMYLQEPEDLDLDTETRGSR